MNYHLINPFSRPENFEELRARLSAYPVQWHLLLDDPPDFEIEFTESWIHRYPISKTTPALQMWRRCINWFAGEGPIVDSDRYLIMADDCVYEPGFFEKLDAVEGEVLIVSAKRGDQTPAVVDPLRAHGSATLLAHPDFMHPCQVSAEQIVLSGRLFRRINLIVHQACDGYMIETMTHDFETKYLPEAFVWFNYLEPGRWNNVTKLCTTQTRTNPS